MFLRSLFAAAIALLLSGCTGWWSETRLIPASARDTAGLKGTYVLDGHRSILGPAEDGKVRVVDPAGQEPPGEIALALLREEAPRPAIAEKAAPEEGEPAIIDLPDRSYLMEFSVTGDDDKTVYTYAIGRIGFSDDGTADEVEMFSLLCSKASEKFAARKEKQVCIFDDYANLRAAALDALAWYDDARMVIDTTTWQREIEPDKMASHEMAPVETASEGP